MTGARLIMRRFTSSEYPTSDAAQVAGLGRVELGHKRRSFDEVARLAKRGVIEQETEGILWHRRSSPFAPATSIWVDNTDVASSGESPNFEELVPRQVVFNCSASAAEVPNQPDAMGAQSFVLREDCARSGSLDDQGGDCPLPSASDHPDVRAGSDRGHALKTVSCDRKPLSRSSANGDVLPADSWQDEKNLREWVDLQPVEEALRPPGLMQARAAMMNSRPPRSQLIIGGGVRPLSTSAALVNVL